MRRRKDLEDMAWAVGHIIGVAPSRLMPPEPQTAEQQIALIQAFSASMRGPDGG